MTVRATNETITTEVTEAIRSDYQTGNFTQAEIASKYSLTVPRVNVLLKGVKPGKRKYTHTTSKFAERNAQVLAKAQAGASTRELAAEFGVTHQNISLILKKAGFVPITAHKERLAVNAAARQERLGAVKKEKADKKLEKIKALSEVWKSGASMEEVRVAAGVASINAASVKIVLLRRRFPDLFPKRNPFGRTAELDTERRQKVDTLSAAWKEGKSIAECAAVVGWSEKIVSRTIPALRKSLGVEAFPYRRNPKAGKSEAELEQELGDTTAPQA